MEGIRIAEERLKKLIEFEAREDIIEYERNRLERYKNRWVKLKEIAKTFTDKSKELEAKHSMECIVEIVFDEEIKKYNMEEPGVIILCKMVEPETKKRTVIANRLYMYSNYFEVVSDSLPLFTNEMTVNDKYITVNSLNKQDPLIKVHLTNTLDRGHIARVISYLYADEVTDIDRIVERMKYVTSFIKKYPNYNYILSSAKFDEESYAFNARLNKKKDNIDDIYDATILSKYNDVDDYDNFDEDIDYETLLELDDFNDDIRY